MAKQYLDKLSAFIGQALAECSENSKLECKHFFGGAALYADQQICITLTPVGLAIKLPEKIRQQLFQYKIAVPLRYFPAGPIKKEYALFTHGIADSDEALFTYVKVGIEYVLKLAKS
jgi:hypothetical protein